MKNDDALLEMEVMIPEYVVVLLPQLRRTIRDIYYKLRPDLLTSCSSFSGLRSCDCSHSGVEGDPMLASSCLGIGSKPAEVFKLAQ